MPYAVGLINPPWIQLKEELYFPSNLTILSSALKVAGFGSHLIDLNLYAARDMRFMRNAINASLKTIDHYADACDCFGFTTYCFSYPLVLLLAQRMSKRYGKPVLLGGPQATFTARRTMEIAPYIDYIVMHEGDITLVELIRMLSKGGNPTNVEGLMCRNGDAIVETPSRPLIKNLDDTPFPDFAAIDMQDYFEVYDSVQVSIDSGRGCPFNCTFCSTSQMWKHMCRMKSPSRIIAEMDSASELLGVNYFFLTQDNLTTNRRYIGDLCAALQSRPYKWHCYSRSDTLDEELVKVMKAGGCVGIFFGVESASTRIQRCIKKRLDKRHLQSIIRNCLDNGLAVTTAYILGFPEEKEKDLNATIRSIVHNAARGTQLVIGPLSPMPGSEIYNDSINHLTEQRYRYDPTPALNTALASQIGTIVSQHPDVFSASYTIEHNFLSPKGLQEISFFSRFLADYFSKTTHLLFSHTSLTPLQLFAHMRKYKRFNKLALKRFLKKTKGTCTSEKAWTTINDILEFENILYELKNKPSHPSTITSCEIARSDPMPDFDNLSVKVSPSSHLRRFSINIIDTLNAITNETRRPSIPSKPTSLLFYDNILHNAISFIQTNIVITTMMRHAEKTVPVPNYLAAISTLFDDQQDAEKAFLDLWQSGLLVCRKRS